MLEPCGAHSGLERTTEEHERRLNEYHQTTVGFHRRVDALNDSLVGMEKRLTEKMTDYASQMADRQVEVLALYDKDVRPRLDGLERNQRVAWKVALYSVIGLASAISFFRQPIGKLLKWVFWG